MVKTVKIIEEMTKDDFYELMIKGICKTAEFSHLVSSGADKLTKKERKQIKLYLRKINPEIKKLKYSDLDIIAKKIASRAVKVR